MPPKTFQNVTKNHTEKTTKKSSKNVTPEKPVLGREREARLISNRVTSVASVRKLSKRQSLRSLARSARSRAALATGFARIPQDSLGFARIP